MNNKNIVIGIIVFLVIAGGFYLYRQNTSPKSDITFPAGGETLIAGKAYDIKWRNVGHTGYSSSSTTQIFLVDKALLNQGASVSIIDRIYDIPDTGSYKYTIPTSVQDSSYFIVVGTTTSNIFTISSK